MMNTRGCGNWKVTSSWLVMFAKAVLNNLVRRKKGSEKWLIVIIFLVVVKLIDCLSCWRLEIRER